MARKLISGATTVALLVAVAALAYWAGTNAVAPPTLPIASHSVETYVVQTGSVGRAIDVSISASWPASQTVLAGSSGLVTSVLHPGGSVAVAGSILATVDLEPVVIAPGTVPMFRTISEGMSGPDVRQFQELLGQQGFLEGPADGRFGPITEAATRAWQQALGAERDGVVSPGSLVFAGSLPARLEFLIPVGHRVDVGTELVRILASEPTFTATIAASQRADLASGMAVEISGPDGASWSGALGTFVARDDGRYAAEVTGIDCEPSCDAIALHGDTVLAGTVTLVPTTTGVVVPTSALTLEPSGSSAVTLVGGEKLEVRILAEADGFAIVEGLAAGQEIELPSRPAP